MAAIPPSSETDDDALMTLLTDALRAGPASPEWSRALAIIQQQGAVNADEYRLLLDARQNLESGRNYKQVRGGTAFGRRVLDGVEAIAAARPPKRRHTLTIVIGVGLLAVIGAAVSVGVWIARGGLQSKENLAAVYLDSVTAAATFDGPLPQGWRTIGTLPLDPKRGLRPVGATSPPTTFPANTPGHRHDFVGGGIVTTSGLNAYRPMAVEGVFTFGRITDDVVPELFVSDSPQFSVDRATSPHELAWLIRGGEMKLALADGKFAGQSVKVTDHARLAVRIIVGATNVRVVVNDQALYDGPSHLGSGERFAGVRLLRHGNAPADLRVVSIEVLQS